MAKERDAGAGPGDGGRPGGIDGAAPMATGARDGRAGTMGMAEEHDAGAGRGDGGRPGGIDGAAPMATGARDGRAGDRNMAEEQDAGGAGGHGGRAGAIAGAAPEVAAPATATGAATVTGTATLRHAAVGVRKAAARIAAGGTTAPRRSSGKMTTARRKLFLETLAATYSVARSAGVAGVAVSTVRDLRYRDAGFSALWDAALAAGRERLREDLYAYALGHRPSGANPDNCDFDAPAPVPFDPELALKVLAMESRGGVGGRRTHAAAPTQAQVDAALLRRLEALARSRA